MSRSSNLLLALACVAPLCLPQAWAQGPAATPAPAGTASPAGPPSLPDDTPSGLPASSGSRKASDPDAAPPDARAPLRPPGVEGLPDHPPVVPDGQVHISRGRLGDLRWRYRVVNGTSQPVASVHLLVPARSYDSRLVPTIPYFGLPTTPQESRRWPFVPTTWSTRRQPGQGAQSNTWVVSWMATDTGNLLPPGRAMHVDLRSNAMMTDSKHQAVMTLGQDLSDHLSYPWDSDFMATLLEPARTGRPDVVSVQVPFPSFSSNELQLPEKTLQQAAASFDLGADIWGRGRRFGDEYQLNVRTQRPVVTRLEAGSLLYPSSPRYDLLMVGRDERLSMNLGEQASIGLSCYSLTYDREALPARSIDPEAGYSLAPAAPKQGAAAAAAAQPTELQLQAARRILQQASSLRPTLTTGLGARYEAYLVQWGIWRKLRLLEGRPLEVVDLERFLTLDFVPLAQGKKQHLTPVQVALTAKRLWADTDALLYAPALPAPSP